MKLGATITSERGKTVMKTANDFLNIQITNSKGLIVYILRVREDKIQLNLKGKDSEWTLYEEKINKELLSENLKHDNNNVQDPSIGLMHYCNSECEHYKK